MRRSFFAVCGLVVLVTPPTVGSQAGSGAANTDPVRRQHAAIGAPQIRHAIRDKVNNGLVSIVSGSLDATDLTEVTDLASSLDGMRDLRYQDVRSRSSYPRRERSIPSRISPPRK